MGGVANQIAAFVSNTSKFVLVAIIPKRATMYHINEK